MSTSSRQSTAAMGFVGVLLAVGILIRVALIAAAVVLVAHYLLHYDITPTLIAIGLAWGALVMGVRTLTA